MSEIMIKIGWALLSKLMTEMFVSRALVYSLKAMSEKTSNQLDDKIVGAVAESLGVK